MSRLVVHDLPESVELDRQAMAAITGGAAIRGQAPRFEQRRTLTGLGSHGATATATSAPTAPLPATLLFSPTATLSRGRH